MPNSEIRSTAPQATSPDLAANQSGNLEFSDQQEDRIAYILADPKEATHGDLDLMRQFVARLNLRMGTLAEPPVGGKETRLSSQSSLPNFDIYEGQRNKLQTRIDELTIQ